MGWEFVKAIVKVLRKNNRFTNLGHKNNIFLPTVTIVNNVTFLCAKKTNWSGFMLANKLRNLKGWEMVGNLVTESWEMVGNVIMTEE